MCTCKAKTTALTRSTYLRMYLRDIPKKFMMQELT